ncbi:MAG: glycosyltransferase [Cyclobacteriaceae bacterium]
MHKVAQIRIVMLANGHVPFDTRIFHKEARTLVDAGFSVSIIVPHEKDEEREGVFIIAVPLNKKGWRKLVVNPINILKKALRQPAHAIFHLHDSDILLTGLVLKILGRKVIYDAHEDTPLQIRYQHWLPKILKGPYAAFYFALEKLCGWCFDAIIVAEPVMAKYFPTKKTFLLRNFPIKKSFVPSVNIPYGEREKTLIHVGVLSKVRGLFEMLEGFTIATKEVDVYFLLGGQFAPPSLAPEVIPNYPVNFVGWVSYPKLIELLFQSRAGIIIPHPIERYKTNYPVKMFEFMAAGLPVIASREGESASFINEAQCGILVNPLDHNEISNAIKWIFTNTKKAKEMGERGQALIFNRYNWEHESRVLLELYANLNKKD